METGHVHPPGFQSLLEEFKKNLKKRDQENFNATTYETLRASIASLQAPQHAQRRLKNLNRLMPFLRAVEQYGNVVRGFCDTNEILAFIWVSNSKENAKPLKLIAV
jgi:hypothetical protein